MAGHRLTIGHNQWGGHIQSKCILIRCTWILTLQVYVNAAVVNSSNHRFDLFLASNVVNILLPLSDSTVCIIHYHPVPNVFKELFLCLMALSHDCRQQHLNRSFRLHSGVLVILFLEKVFIEATEV